MTDPSDMHDRRRRRPSWPALPATKGLVVRHRTSGVVGKVTRFAGTQVTVRDDNGREHVLPNAPGAFSAAGSTVTLVKAPKAEKSAESITASGSVAAPPSTSGAKVAVASRILVEGIHDAELVERIWGADLRDVGVVVEPLHGIEDLQGVIDDFGPSNDRRLGVLLDHLVSGSKETRIADEIERSVGYETVMIRGHDFVDIWQAIRPEVLGIKEWPEIPMGQDWKQGICSALGFGGSSGELWKIFLNRVSSYKDLEPALIGAVEELIDFVAPPPDYED